MTAVLAERSLPTKAEVTQPVTKEGAITTTQAEDEATANSVQAWLNKQNPNLPVASVKAVTAQTPVEKSPQMKAVGAEVIGEHESILDNLVGSAEEATGAATHYVTSNASEMFGQGSEGIRRVEGEGWRQRLARRIKGKIPFVNKK